MKKAITISMFIVAVLAVAYAQTPVQTVLTIPASSKAVVTYDVPAGVAGQLLTVQTAGIVNAGTVKIEHVIPIPGGPVTNEILAAAVGNSVSNFPAVRPVWLARGDKLLFTPSATNGIPGKIIIRAAKAD